MKCDRFLLFLIVLLAASSFVAPEASVAQETSMLRAEIESAFKEAKGSEQILAKLIQQAERGKLNFNELNRHLNARDTTVNWIKPYLTLATLGGLAGGYYLMGPGQEFWTVHIQEFLNRNYNAGIETPIPYFEGKDRYFNYALFGFWSFGLSVMATQIAILLPAKYLGLFQMNHRWQMKNFLRKFQSHYPNQAEARVVYDQLVNEMKSSSWYGDEREKLAKTIYIGKGLLLHKVQMARKSESLDAPLDTETNELVLLQLKLIQSVNQDIMKRLSHILKDGPFKNSDERNLMKFTHKCAKDIAKITGGTIALKSY